MNKSEEKKIIAAHVVEQSKAWSDLYGKVLYEIQTAKNVVYRNLSIGYARGVVTCGYITGLITKKYREQCFAEIKKLELA